MKNIKCHHDAPLVILTAALLAGVAFLVTYQIGRPLWLDDTHSTYHAFHGPLGIIQSLRTDSHPPLYFLFLSIWMGLVGMGEILLRVPSVLFFLLTGLVLFTSGRRIGHAEAGVLFALFFLFNPTAVQHAHGVRMYALLGLLSALSTTLFLGLATSEGEARRSVWSGYILVNVLGTFTHYWFFLLLAGQALGTAIFSRRAARIPLLLSLGISTLPFAILWTPVLLEQIQGSPTSWLEVPGGFWLASAPLELLGGWDMWDYRGLARTFYLLLALSCLIRLGPGRPGLVTKRELAEFLGDRSARLLFLIPATVMTLALLLSQISPFYHVRYTIVAIPAFAMLLGLVLHRLGDRRLVPLVALAFLGASCIVRGDALAVERDRDDRASTLYLVENYQDGDEILHITLNYAPTTHYLRALAPGQTFSQTVFPSEVAAHPGWWNAEETVGDTIALRQEAEEIARSLRGRPGFGRIWLLAALPERGSPELIADAIVTRILERELRPGFVLESTRPLRGWRHTQIQLYTPRGPDQGEREEEEGA